MRSLDLLIAAIVLALPAGAQTPAPQAPSPGPFRPGPATSPPSAGASAGSLNLTL